MSDKSALIAQMMAAADTLRSADDNLLRAIAMIAAGGKIQVAPTGQLFGREAKPLILLPERMYDRLLELVPQPSDNPKEGGAA